MLFEYRHPSCSHTAMLLLLATPLLSVEAQAADNLNFKGDLVAAACTLHPGDAAIDINFAEISAQSLYLNTRTVGRPFELHLEGCDISIADSVTVMFGGVESAQLPGFLALGAGSSARGIAIGLETSDDQPLPLNVSSDEQTLSNGANVISLKAFVQGEKDAIANQKIRKGRFTATSTFTLAYP